MHENRRVTFIEQLPEHDIDEMSHVKRSIRGDDFPAKNYMNYEHVTDINELNFVDKQVPNQQHHQDIQHHLQNVPHQHAQPPQQPTDITVVLQQLQQLQQQVSMLANNDLREDYAQDKEITCRSITGHVGDCALCTKFYAPTNDNTLYIIIIIFLVVVIGLLIKKLVDGNN